jgi:RNA polymerase sigma-70 factor (ECF subfamily)
LIGRNWLQIPMAIPSLWSATSAVQQLTPDQQQVISLKFLEGLSNQERAAVLDKPVGTVKSLQHRALAALHRLLAPG